MDARHHSGERDLQRMQPVRLPRLQHQCEGALSSDISDSHEEERVIWRSSGMDNYRFRIDFALDMVDVT